MRDDKSKLQIPAYRCITNYKKPSKGDILFKSGVTNEEVESMAARQNYENSLFRIPLSGAKGAIGIDFNDLSAKEVTRAFNQYTKEFGDKGFLKPEKDFNETSQFCTVKDDGEMIKTYRE